MRVVLVALTVALIAGCAAPIASPVERASSDTSVMTPMPVPSTPPDADMLAWEAALCSTLETIPDVEAAIAASADGRVGGEFEWLSAKWDYAVARLAGMQEYPEAPPPLWSEAADVNLAIGDVFWDVMFAYESEPAAQAALDQLKTDLEALKTGHGVCSQAEREVWAEDPVPLPVPDDTLEFFTSSLAMEALGCWDGLHGRAAEDSVGQCRISWQSPVHRPALDLIDYLIDSGAHRAATTCPAVWAATAEAVLGLYDQVRRDLIWPAEINEEPLFADLEDQSGQIASDDYNFLVGGKVRHRAVQRTPRHA